MACHWCGGKGSDKILKRINARLDKLEVLLEKVQAVEEQVLVQENHVSLGKAVSSLENENNALRLKVDDLEGRSCHNNFKIVGIPEQEEGLNQGKGLHFLGSFLIGKRSSSYAGGEHDSWSTGTTTCSFSPFRTPEVMQQQREFNKAASSQRQLKVGHSLLFPEKFRSEYKGQFKIFTTPDEAMTFLNTDFLKNVP